MQVTIILCDAVHFRSLDLRLNLSGWWSQAANEYKALDSISRSSLIIPKSISQDLLSCIIWLHLAYHCWYSSWHLPWPNTILPTTTQFYQAGTQTLHALESTMYFSAWLRPLMFSQDYRSTHRRTSLIGNLLVMLGIVKVSFLGIVRELKASNWGITQQQFAIMMEYSTWSACTLEHRLRLVFSILRRILMMTLPGAIGHFQCIFYWSWSVLGRWWKGLYRVVGYNASRHWC